MGCLAGRPERGLEPPAKGSTNILVSLPSSYLYREGSIRKDYDIVRVIFPGELRRVLEAKNKKTGEIFAVKEIAKGGRVEVGVLLKEVGIISSLDHANLVKLKEVYEEKKKFYIVQEMLRGGELFDFIAQSKSLSETLAAAVMRQVLEAVAYCHANHVVLRNLKPENIMLSQPVSRPEDVHIKLVDFGMATMVTGGRRLSKIVGTELYSAPEVFNGNYGEICDMWSAGCVLFVMLTGELPFTGANSEAIRTEVTKGEIAMTSPVWSQISDEAKDLIRKMIEVNPDFRIRASEALDHPWISSNIHLSHDTGRAMGILTLKKFQGDKKLKQALASFIADRFSSEQDAEELRQIFQTMDIDHSGKLSRGELIDGLSRQMSPEEAVDLVDSILKETDADHSQTLDYSEFVAASSLQKQMLSRKMVETAFQVLDKDKSGTLNVKELMALLGEAVQGGEAALKQLIAQADTNKDGELSLKEFTELLLHPQSETS